MLMPVTAMYEYSYFSTSQNDIGFDLAYFAIKSETIAKLMKCFAGENFGFGVAATYAGHHSATSFFIDYINH